MLRIAVFCLWLCWTSGFSVPGRAEPPTGIPERDARLEVRDLHSVCGMPRVGSQQEWLRRAASLRHQILVSAGLWPLPPKTPLNPQIFGRIERDGYTIEKVYFESYPGFFVTGNLYRPRGLKGPFPAILSPHGHWEYGRLNNSELGSIPARAIHFARQGAVVFNYDMVGYNDSFQIDHEFKSDRRDLWGINLLGLHLWNSIRAVDFLISLPDVDRERLGCTGASGGGTQTFLLTAVDERIKVSAPVNMISGHMQGGDLCENAPHLRIDTCNVEIGALMAPRPMLMVSATGDWTTDTPRMEFPSIRSIYNLFGEEDKITNAHFHAPHNYNRDSREAVYNWFARWLLGRKDVGPVKEKAFTVEKPADVMVFFGRKFPENAKDPRQLTDYLIGSTRKQFKALKPADAAGLQRFTRMMRPALRYALMVGEPEPAEVLSARQGSPSTGKFMPERLLLSFRGSRVESRLWRPRGGSIRAGVVVVHPDGYAALMKDGSDRPGRLLTDLLRNRFMVLSIDTFNRYSSKSTSQPPARKVEFFGTYNRSDDANRVQDILTAVAYLKGKREVQQVYLVGLEKAGLWCLLARAMSPQVKRLVADAAQFATEDDQAYLRDLPISGIRRAGDFRTAVTLAIPEALLVHNTGDGFPIQWIRDAYQAGGAEGNIAIEPNKLSEARMIRWLRTGEL